MTCLVQMKIPDRMMKEVEAVLEEVREAHNEAVLAAGDDLGRLIPLSRRGRRLTTTHMLRALVGLGLDSKPKIKTLLKILAADPVVRGRKEVLPVVEKYDD